MWRRISRRTIESGALALALASACSAQVWAALDFEAPPVTYPSIAELASSPEEFVPAGWSLIDRKSGDLNADGRADLAILIRMRDKANMVPLPHDEKGETWDTNPFMLVVAFAEPVGGYRLAASSYRVFDRPDVPYNGSVEPNKESFAIERGILVIFNEYLRNWDRQRFRWQNGAFRLIGYDEGGASGACVETKSINYLTGTVAWKLEPMEGKGSASKRLKTKPVTLPTLDQYDKNEFMAFETVDGDGPQCPAY